MKIFTSILLFIAFALILVNLYVIDYSNPTEGDSFVALVGVGASFCAVLILLIFKMSKKIEEKLKG